MAQLWWKSDRPEPGILLALTFAAVCVAWASTEAAKARECPPFTKDGRPLIRMGRISGECAYDPIPRPMAQLSPLEHRRMARQKELMK
jgi:hypothetical protein